MKLLYSILLLVATYPAKAQLTVSTDTTDIEIAHAVQFLRGYINEFKKGTTPDYMGYWSQEDVKGNKMSDAIAFSISSNYPTYRFSMAPMVFFAKKHKDHVQLKTMFWNWSDSNHISLFAITNHYIKTDSKGSYFVSEMTLHPEAYRSEQNSNIHYHFPKDCPYRKSSSDTMLVRLREIEKEWNFKPVHIEYYYAQDREALDKMKGMDYCLSGDQPEPSGISFHPYKTVYCQGLGEGYLHEVLHIYFNPLYDSSVVLHGLVYFYGGGIGHDFNWLIDRMNQYLRQYPDTDLTNYDTLMTKDKFLHIDNTVHGLLCKMVYEKDGVAGLKRLLAFRSVDELFEKEFHVAKEKRDAFLKEAFRKAGN